MHYDNKTNEELIELLEERDEKIEEMDCYEAQVDDLEAEVGQLTDEINSYDVSLSDREEVSEKAFNAGYNNGFGDCHDNDRAKPMKGNLKHWLNFKMENRL